MDTMRFLGWAPVREALGKYFPDRKPGDKIELRVQYAEPTSPIKPLWELCAQELYATLAASLVRLGGANSTVIEEEVDGDVRLTNATVNLLADAFVQNGLGDPTSALLRITPALGSQLRVPPVLERSTALTNAAIRYRTARDWNRAEPILKRDCDRYCKLEIGNCTRTK